MTTARQLLFSLFLFTFCSLFSLASSCLRQQPQALLFATTASCQSVITAAMARPTGLIATKGIELLTWGKQASRSRTSSRFCAALFFFLFLLAASASAHHIHHLYTPIHSTLHSHLHLHQLPISPCFYALVFLFVILISDPR